MRNLLGFIAFCLAALAPIFAAAQVWSPDAKQLIIESSTPLRLDFTSASAAVAPTPTPLLPNNASGSLFAFSPDGKTLAYRNGSGSLVLMNLADGKTITLESHLEAPVSWAPDSKTLAAVCRNEAGQLILHIDYREGGYRIKPITLPFHNLADTCRPVQWVPETDNVLLAGGDGTKRDLWLVDAGIPTQLTQTGDALGFQVSPDGNRVVWIRRSPNTHYILFSLYELIINARSLRKLDFPSRLPQVNPNPHDAVDAVTQVVFSTDLSHIAFTSFQHKSPTTVTVWLTDIKGSMIQKITTLASPSTALPSFSPDGHLLAIFGKQQQTPVLVLFDLQANLGRSITLNSPGQ